jgi:hypothetical protein
MSPATKLPPRIHFSFRSPYSWLAHHDIAADHPELLTAVEWRPFWEPDEASKRLLTRPVAGSCTPPCPGRSTVTS